MSQGLATFLIAPVQVPAQFSQLDGPPELQRFVSSFAAQITRQFNSLVLPQLQTNTNSIASNAAGISALINLNNNRILRGTVDHSGNVLTGTGFTCVENSAGVYVITVTTPFSAAPVVVATPTLGGATGFTVESDSTVSTLSINFRKCTTGVLTEPTFGFGFIAIGDP